MKDYAPLLARKALELGAIRLQASDPFLWASGYRMPIYNDNRKFLSDPEARMMIAKAFNNIAKEIGYDPDCIAGTSTAGIPHATTLGDMLKKPVSYVRGSGKNHGLKRQIEGLVGDSYGGRNVLLIEDLISTGGSSLAAVRAIVNAGGLCPWCFAIFTYGMEKSKTRFAEFEPRCELKTILDYDFVIREAESIGYVDSEQASLLRSWREDPFGWGEKNGFPREER